ncbi:MAG: HPr-rel-A system PqqD family peptide chaperone [Alphaproteobacteria bacterium]|nr:HPr-rel-A system PqqD family peptide chaperone [Alphaproteobacteria bacterium]
MALLLRRTERLLRERRWGDESVVFDTYSGETHQLDALAAAIFHRVTASGSIELDALCHELLPSSGEGASDISAEAIGSAARRLRHTGLIRVDET